MMYLFVFVLIFIVSLIYQICKPMYEGVPTSELKYFYVSDNGHTVNVYPLNKLPGEYLEFYIAGWKYRQNIENYLGEFVADLVPEPRNKYDKNAIKIVACRDGHHVGYVPANLTSTIRMKRTLPCVCFCYIGKRRDSDGVHYFTSCYINTPGI